jgi:hypothetical protein
MQRSSLYDVFSVALATTVGLLVGEENIISDVSYDVEMSFRILIKKLIT